MKIIALALSLALSAIACDTPPDISSSPPSADAGVQALEQAQKIPPIPGPITPPGGGQGPGVPGPIDRYCTERELACERLCHASFGGWCLLCEDACDLQCQQEYGICIFR